MPPTSSGRAGPRRRRASCACLRGEYRCGAGDLSHLYAFTLAGKTRIDVESEDESDRPAACTRRSAMKIVAIGGGLAGQLFIASHRWLLLVVRVSRGWL